MLPNPPMITTAKLTTMTLTDSPGCTEINGAVNAPPSAARNTPAVKAAVYTRGTFTPMLALISGL